MLKIILTIHARFLKIISPDSFQTDSRFKSGTNIKPPPLALPDVQQSPFPGTGQVGDPVLQERFIVFLELR